MSGRSIPWIALLLSSGGCTLGPNYTRPAIETPDAYRGASLKSEDSGDPGLPLGDEHWWEVFKDPVLQELIRTALQQNLDVRIAASRVEEARAQLALTRANEFPSLAAGANVFTERNPQISPLIPAYQAHAGELDLSVLWNLDFWGKYRRQTEAARASLLASEWGRRATLISVLSSVATAYFQLREVDLSLEISQRTLASRQNSLHLTQVLVEHGSASQLDLHQTEQLVYTAAETIPDLERQVALQENALSILLGKNPGPIARGNTLTEQPVPETVPAGLPSALLERRPDIREAEETLIAANAEVGVARAAFFPSITLTGTAGVESYRPSQLFDASSAAWVAAAALTQPIFEGGGLRGGLKLAQAQKEQMLLTYRQAIINAFEQVSNALVTYRKQREYREQQQRLTNAARDTDRLSKILYQNGGASYLQVLTSETNAFAAELALAAAELNERLALIQLYNALGGGWSS
jgi:multidrug efflux system outer membrane protein